MLTARLETYCQPDHDQQQDLKTDNHKQSTKRDNVSLISGSGRVTDGDSLRINNLRIRLYAIDAPELSQNCYDESHIVYSCGKEARQILTNRIGQHPVACQPRSKDFYGRIVATCWIIDGPHACEDLSQFMVRLGYAVVYKKFGGSLYMKDQLVAQNKQRGLWRGAFIWPWIWRQQKRTR